MNRLEALVALNMSADVGTIRLQKLLKFFGSPENIFKASYDKLVSICGVGDKTAQKIKAFKENDLKKELAGIKKLGLEILTQEDSSYPENLRNIYDPPIVLYVKGKIIKQDANAMALVGSRKASVYGLNMAERFARELSEAGFTVVSGMALGIDTFSHRGALKAFGRTIAVIGSGFNQIYPQENINLVDAIARSGAVISEFSLNAPPTRFSFPRRNRVISGLSKGVLVVEAAQNSGALITADFALEQGRSVFALPGKLDSITSSGTNDLIKQGAKLVTGIEDILEEFEFYAVSKSKSRDTREIPDVKDIDSEEEVVYRNLSEKPVSIDELKEKTTFDLPVLAKLILGLQMKKLVQKLPGKQFIRS